MKKTVAVLGMMCAGCSARVEQKLNQMEGVSKASVNLSTRTVLLDYDPALTSLPQMKEALGQIGYDMVIEEDRNVEQLERQNYRSLRRRVWLSWLFAILCMSISMRWILAGWSDDNRNQLCLIIAALNIIYCGRQFYTTAWKQLIHRSANMDTLVALSTGITFAFSTFNTFWGVQYWSEQGLVAHTYFDASVMIITFVLTGRLLEERAKHSTASAIRSLMGLQPKTAHCMVDGTLVDMPISAVQPFDILEVRAGEKIPVDGIVVAGGALVDEAAMTGESELVDKRNGHRLLAGTIVKSGLLQMKAEAVGQKTVLANMIRMVQEAQGSKVPV